MTRRQKPLRPQSLPLKWGLARDDDVPAERILGSRGLDGVFRVVLSYLRSPARFQARVERRARFQVALQALRHRWCATRTDGECSIRSRTPIPAGERATGIPAASDHESPVDGHEHESRVSRDPRGVVRSHRKGRGHSVRMKDGRHQAWQLAREPQHARRTLRRLKMRVGHTGRVAGTRRAHPLNRGETLTARLPRFSLFNL